MKTYRFYINIVIAILIISGLSFAPVYAFLERDAETPNTPIDELIIKFKPEVALAVYEAQEKGSFEAVLFDASSLDNLNQKYGAHNARRLYKSLEVRDKEGNIIDVISANEKASYLNSLNEKSINLERISDFENVFVVNVDKSQDIRKVAEEYSKNPHVVYAEPNHRIELLLIPNDPEYPNQWALPKIQADLAWDQFASSSDIGRGITVAVLDTGVNYFDQGELAENFWLNPGEFQGVDDDLDGTVTLSELINHGLIDTDGNLSIGIEDLYGSLFEDNIDNDGNNYIDDLIDLLNQLPLR